MSATSLTLGNPHDQGAWQAFAQCGRGEPLLDEFDSGPDAVDSRIYGRGTNPFGTPRLILASIAFGDGSSGDARAAFTALSGPGFARCWARTYDRLNRESGTVVVRPSTVTALASPGLAAPSAAFAINSLNENFGRTARSQLTLTIVRRGPVVEALVGGAYGARFPSAIRLAVARRVAGRLQRVTGAEATATDASAGSCVGPGLSGPALTTTQLSAALHVTVRPVRVQSGSGCEWDGARLPASRTGPYVRYTVQVWFTGRRFDSIDAARRNFFTLAAQFGRATLVPGLGSQAAFVPGQDEVTAQIVVRAAREVFVLSLDWSRSTPRQHNVLAALARDVLARLAG